MTTIRTAAVAGRFYPDDPAELEACVRRELATAAAALQNTTVEPRSSTHPAPKALIVPHAGYVYSGPIAASGFVRLRESSRTIRRVVCIGPSHFVRFPGLATSGAHYFETPLGRVPVDRDLVRTALSCPEVRELDAAHAQEHSLEVQLPFLQCLLSNFTIVPIVVGDARPDAVARVLVELWNGQETLIVVSSDLSHYHDYRAASAMDAETALAIETLRPERLTEDSACGRLAVAGLLMAARRGSFAVERLDLRNSGDTAGPRDRVVGYGAFAFTGSEAS